MKKSELENGMIVEMRNGEKYIVIKDFTKKSKRYVNDNDILLNIDFGDFGVLGTYKENLTLKNKENDCFDIVKVWCLDGCASTKDRLKLLWEREKKNKVEDVFNHLSFMYSGTTVAMETDSNGYNFYVYVSGNKRARAFMDKQKLEKSKFEEVINILVKQLDESILLAFKL